MHKIGLSLVIGVWLLTACTIVRYHEVKPMRQSFDTSVAKTQKILDQIRTDAKDKQGLLEALKEGGADMETSPYAELKDSFELLKKYAKLSDTKVGALRDVRTSFRTLSEGREKITSESDAYDRVNEIKMQVKTLMPELEESVKAYEEEAKTFVGLVEQHRMGKVHVREVRRQLAGFLKELDASLTQVRVNVIRVQKARERGQLSGHTEALYDQIAKNISLIEQERFEVSKLIDQFDREVGRHTTLVVGPGFVTHDMMIVLETRAETIRGLGQEIASLAEQLPK